MTNSVSLSMVRIVINQNWLIKEENERIEKILGSFQKTREADLGNWQVQGEAGY